MKKLFLIRKVRAPHVSQLRLALGQRFLSPQQAAVLMVSKLGTGEVPANADDFAEIAVVAVDDLRVLAALRELARSSGTQLKELEVHYSS